MNNFIIYKRVIHLKSEKSSIKIDKIYEWIARQGQIKCDYHPGGLVMEYFKVSFSQYPSWEQNRSRKVKKIGFKNRLSRGYIIKSPI